MEADARKALKELHTQSINRTAYIRFQEKKIIKFINYSDNEIFRRAVQLGMKVLNLTDKSATLQALTQVAYYNANKF
jgi:hypothetical protein